MRPRALLAALTGLAMMGAHPALALHDRPFSPGSDTARILVSADGLHWARGSPNLRLTRASRLTPRWLAPYLDLSRRVVQRGGWTMTATSEGAGAILAPEPLAGGWYGRAGLRLLHLAGQYQGDGTTARFQTRGLAGEAGLGYRWQIHRFFRVGGVVAASYVADDPIHIKVAGERVRLAGYPGFAWRYGLRFGVAF